VLVQKLGDNVVDFVFKTFVSIITSLGYVAYYRNERRLTYNVSQEHICRQHLNISQESYVIYDVAKYEM
jgi:hypothetical protein